MNTRNESAKRASSMLLFQSAVGAVLLLSFMMLVTNTYTDDAYNTTPKEALDLRHSLQFWHGLSAILGGVLWMALASKESEQKFEHHNGFTIVALGLAVMPSIWLLLLGPLAFVAWVILCERRVAFPNYERCLGAVTCLGFAITVHLLARYEFDLSQQVGIALGVSAFTAGFPGLVFLGLQKMDARASDPEPDPAPS